MIDANYIIVDKEIPSFKHDIGDAGFDMYTTKDMWIFPFHVRKISVNMKVEIPLGYYGYMTSRSGETLKGNVLVPGIIDNSYRGVISALMYRIGILPRKIKKGTRICQLIIQPYKEINWKEVYVLSSSNRGEKGFGESGIN